MGLAAGLQPGDPSKIGPYRLLGQLGSGGMGQVFLGMSAGGRPIAVKVIRAELADDPEFRTRFRSEVDAARKVSGLFTAMVVDADLDGPIPWLATAYVAGPSLTEAVRGHGPMPAQTLLALAGGLAESLSAIHDAGVVHRDLKPPNVLLAEDGPRVIDFGISEAAEASPVVGANVIGSPGYMSPEQVMGLDVGPASDMFSLGAVLAFAATGEGPFGSGSNAAVIHRLVNEPADLSKLPDEVRPLVGKLLAKHPNDRPSARELLAMVGPIQPASGWLSESVIYGSAAEQSAAELLEAASVSAAELLDAASVGTVILFAGPAVGQPGPGSKGGRARHRLSRPVASAGITGGLVVASAAAVFVLTGAGPHTSAPPAQPRAGAALTAPAAIAPAIAPASVTPRSSSSVSPAAPVVNAAMNPSLSEFLTPSSSATVAPANSPAPAKSPAKSPAGSASPSASRSSSLASPSPSPTSSSPASPTASAPASPSPSASAPPTSSSPASPTASAPASPSAPASTPPPASPSPTQSTASSPSSSPSQSASPIASVSASPSASGS